MLLQALGGSQGSGLGAKRQSHREFSALCGCEDAKQGWFGINDKGGVKRIRGQPFIIWSIIRPLFNSHP